MKTKLAFIILSCSFFFSCSSWDSLESYRQVGYTYTTIGAINDRSVSFANGLNALTDRIVIAVNSTPVLLIVEDYTASGYFYLRNSKIRFTINQSKEDADIDMLGLKRGEVNYIHDINETDKTITLADNSKWIVPNAKQWKEASTWLTSPEIIVPTNRPPQGVYFINTSSTETVIAVKVENSTTNSDK